eukprot:Sspe_Gene.40543::Locus_19590_Transcript_1_1_Confidence_1.000_Length_767::g.40543::m.40543
MGGVRLLLLLLVAELVGRAEGKKLCSDEGLVQMCVVFDAVLAKAVGDCIAEGTSGGGGTGTLTETVAGEVTAFATSDCVGSVYCDGKVAKVTLTGPAEASLRVESLPLSSASTEVVLTIGEAEQVAGTMRWSGAVLQGFVGRDGEAKLLGYWIGRETEAGAVGTRMMLDPPTTLGVDLPQFVVSRGGVALLDGTVGRDAVSCPFDVLAEEAAVGLDGLEKLVAVTGVVLDPCAMMGGVP